MSLKCTTDTQDIDEPSGPGAAGAFCLPPGCTNVIIPPVPWKKTVKKHGSKPNPVPFDRCTTFLLFSQLTVILWLSSGSWKVRESLLRVSWECLFLLIKRTEMREKLSSNVFPLPSYLEQEHNVWRCSNHLVTMRQQGLRTKDQQLSGAEHRDGKSLGLDYTVEHQNQDPSLLINGDKKKNLYCLKLTDAQH